MAADGYDSDENSDFVELPDPPIANAFGQPEMEEEEEEEEEDNQGINWDSLVERIEENLRGEGGGGEAELQTIIGELVELKNSSNPLKRYMASRTMVNLFFRENLPHDQLNERVVVPLCLRMIREGNNPFVKFEAVSELTDITAQFSRCIIDNGAVPLLVAELKSESLELAEQAVWALGCLVSNGTETRDIVMQHNVLDGILHLINLKDTHPSILHPVIYAVVMLARYQGPSASSFEEMRPLLPPLVELLNCQDQVVLGQVCCALHILAGDNNNDLQAIIDAGAVPPLVNLLSTDEVKVLLSVLRTVCDVTTGTVEQAETVIAAGFLDKLPLLLVHANRYVVAESLRIVGNIATGNEKQIKAIMDSASFQQIHDLMKSGDPKILNQAVCTVSNIFMVGSTEQILDLIEKFNVLKPFINALEAADSEVVIMVQSGLMALLAEADQLGGNRNLRLAIEELGGLQKLQALKNHTNDKVVESAVAIVEEYFGENENESSRGG